MTNELKKKLHDISQTFYSWLEKMTVENWREPIEDPVDTFCNYDDEAGKELARLYSEYENDDETTAEIDGYMDQVVKAVNNGTVVEHRGGARVNAGRKAKPENERRQQLAISCTFEQKAAIVAAAEKEGITTAAYVLRACGVDKL